MFALRKTSSLLRTMPIVKVESSVAVRFFTDAVEEKPKETGDPEVIEFINKVGLIMFYI